MTARGASRSPRSDDQMDPHALVDKGACLVGRRADFRASRGVYDASVAGPGNASKDFIEIQTVVQAVIVLFTVFVRHWPRALSVKVALKVSPGHPCQFAAGIPAGTGFVSDSMPTRASPSLCFYS